jgi:sarcosine oxidase subunit alpha
MANVAPLPPAPAARAPLHHWHAGRGARFTDRAGWQIVLAYSTPEREIEAARSGLALADVSATAKTSLRGPGVADLARGLGAEGDVLDLHQVGYTAGPGLACRLAAYHLLLLGSVPGSPPELPNGEGLVRTDETSDLAGIWVVGPECEGLLRRLTPLDVRVKSLPVNSCAETALAGVEALLVRTAELSLPSLRVYVPWDLGEHVWERMLEAGWDKTITPLGTEALGRLYCERPGAGA